MSAPPDQSLKRTPLHDLHAELGAKLVPFAGYHMPVNYPAGVLAEHNHTRAHASLFDVSHMGQFRLSGADPAAAIETLVPSDIAGLKPGRMRYTMFTNEAAGILDDLMVTRCDDHLLVVVNAACKERDLAHLRDGLAGRAEIEVLDNRALIALQGPAAAAVMARLAPSAAELRFMAAATMAVAGIEDVVVSRSGYTGEDGFEISVPAARAEALCRLLLAEPEVAPAGLGARDSLRLEAGLCLYGHDLDETTSPVEAALSWTIGKRRDGGFPGDGIIARQLAEGTARRRVGMRPADRAPAREGTEIRDTDGTPLGHVTSGSFGPTVGGPIAMGYIDTAAAAAAPETELRLLVRGTERAARVVPLPFVPHRYLTN